MLLQETDPESRFPISAEYLTRGVIADTPY
jgi:hypothetical protein